MIFGDRKHKSHGIIKKLIPKLIPLGLMGLMRPMRLINDGIKDY